MTLVALALGVASIVLGLIKWLRVSQREHYIGGACLTTASRWVEQRPPNGWLVVVGGFFLLGALVAVVLDAGGPASMLAGLAAVSAAAFPWPMPLISKSARLRMTRRASTLALGAIVLVSGLSALLAVGTGLVVAVAAVACAVPAVVDGAAVALDRLERSSLERYRKRAAAKLAQVQPFVIAVTGSWGKTSTKNHIRDLLAESADVVASPASWNNTAGLSRTVNEHLGDATEVLVAEMGMYKPGEIRDICSWLRPNVAVICAIGPMHLERVGTIERIVAAKAEILERADIAVLWVDEPYLAELADTCAVPKIWRVGSRGGQRLDVEVEDRDDEVVIWVNGSELGAYPRRSGLHPGNVGCAVAAALQYGVPARRVSAKLSHLESPDHRATATTTERGVVIIDDTFNSNPVGSAVAVSTLATLVEGRRAVVTPGMVELGSRQDQENRNLAATVVASGATLVVVGWTNRKSLWAGARERAVLVADRADALDWVRANLGAGDGVLWENDLPDHYP